MADKGVGGGGRNVVRRKNSMVKNFAVKTVVDLKWWSQVERALCFGKDIFSRTFRVHGGSCALKA